VNVKNKLEDQRMRKKYS